MLEVVEKVTRQGPRLCKPSNHPTKATRVSLTHGVSSFSSFVQLAIDLLFVQRGYNFTDSD